MKRVFAWLTVCLLAGCLAGCGGEKRVVTSDTLYVPRIEGMTEAFILGMDASIVPWRAASGTMILTVGRRTFLRSFPKTGSITSGFGCGWIPTTAPVGATAAETATSAPPSPSASEPPGTA